MILGDRFCFVHVPKTGGTSVQEALRAHGRLDPFYKHSFAAVLRDHMLCKRWDGLFSFAFVRHPLPWLVSLFEHDRRAAQRGSFGNFLRWGMASPHFNDGVPIFSRKMEAWLDGRMRWWRLCEADDFAGFVRAVWAGDVPVEDQHRYVWERPTWSDAAAPVVDFIGRFERLDEDFSKVCERLKLAAQLPRRNVGGYGNWRERYTPELEALVRDRFRADLDLFNYGDTP